MKNDNGFKFRLIPKIESYKYTMIIYWLKSKFVVSKFWKR